MAAPGQKVVLITGCSSGIGLCIASLLAKDEQQRYYGKKRRKRHKCFPLYCPYIKKFAITQCSFYTRTFTGM